MHHNTTLIDGVYWHYYWYQSDKISTSFVWDQKVQWQEIKEMSMSSPTLCFCLCRSCVCDDSLRHLSANSAVSALSGFRSSPSKFLHPLCLTLVPPLLITLIQKNNTNEQNIYVKKMKRKTIQKLETSLEKQKHDKCSQSKRCWNSFIILRLKMI